MNANLANAPAKQRTAVKVDKKEKKEEEKKKGKESPKLGFFRQAKRGKEQGQKMKCRHVFNFKS
jgi:hypothetical protein